MKTRRLTSEQLKLLQELAKKRGVSLPLHVGKDGSLELTEKQKEQLLEAITQEFTEGGIRPDSEPNGMGLNLEDLLDRVNSLP